MKKFSVVIPLYNKASYIVDTVNSVLKQTYQDFEIIVVDDGSKDDGVSRLETIKDPRIKIIRQKNQGVSVARNTGVWHADGKYIAFLDADDNWNVDYLEQISELIGLYPQSDIFVTGYNVLMAEGKIKHSNPKATGAHGTISYWETLKHGYDFVWTSATVIRRSVIIAVGGFKPGERIGQDLDLWARVAQKNPIVAYSEKRCVNYNRNAENNARVRVRVANADAYMKVLRYELKNEKRTEEEKECIAVKLRKKVVVYIFTTILSKDRKGARKSIRMNKVLLGKTLCFMLYGASVLPNIVNLKVFNMRMKLF